MFIMASIATTLEDKRIGEIKKAGRKLGCRWTPELEKELTLKGLIPYINAGGTTIFMQTLASSLRLYE